MSMKYIHKVVPQQLIFQYHQHPQKETLSIYSHHAFPSSNPDSPHHQLMATTNLPSVSMDLNIVVDEFL